MLTPRPPPTAPRPDVPGPGLPRIGGGLHFFSSLFFYFGVRGRGAHLEVGLGGGLGWRDVALPVVVDPWAVGRVVHLCGARRQMAKTTALGEAARRQKPEVAKTRGGGCGGGGGGGGSGGGGQGEHGGAPVVAPFWDCAAHRGDLCTAFPLRGETWQHPLPHSRPPLLISRAPALAPAEHSPHRPPRIGPRAGQTCP